MYEKTVLPNGIRILSERLEFLRSVSLGIWVNAGSRDEIQEQNGISHFIEHMSFKGTRHRTAFQIAKELDAIGGHSNAFTGKENTCFYARVLDTHCVRLARILSDLFLNSTFDPGDMDREKQVILQEISMVEDTPDDNILVLFERLFWGDHPIGMPVLGTDQTVSALEKEGVINYFEKAYAPERIVIAAAGRVDHKELVSLFEPVFDPLSLRDKGVPERMPPCTRASVSVYAKDLEQVHLCLGGEAPFQGSDRRFASIILNTILGGNMSSRLFQEIREKQGLAYAVNSFGYSYADTGLLGVYMATEARNVNPALEIIQKEITGIQRGDLSEADLEEAKEHLIGATTLSSEGSDSRMMRMAKNEFTFGRYVSYDELISRLRAVSVDEVIQAARDIFKTGRVSLVTLGPLQENDLDAGCLSFG